MTALMQPRGRTPADYVIFAGIAVNALVIVLIVYFYVL